MTRPPTRSGAPRAPLPRAATRPRCRCAAGSNLRWGHRQWGTLAGPRAHPRTQVRPGSGGKRRSRPPPVAARARTLPRARGTGPCLLLPLRWGETAWPRADHEGAAPLSTQLHQWQQEGQRQQRQEQGGHARPSRPTHPRRRAAAQHLPRLAVAVVTALPPLPSAACWRGAGRRCLKCPYGPAPPDASAGESRGARVPVRAVPRRTAQSLAGMQEQQQQEEVVVLLQTRLAPHSQSPQSSRSTRQWCPLSCCPPRRREPVSPQQQLLWPAPPSATRRQEPLLLPLRPALYRAHVSRTRRRTQRRRRWRGWHRPRWCRGQSRL